MLQLKNVKKSYTTAGFTQNALDGVSVAFRDNEFAAVLGPSGSGKTTMLNVIGGLDRYDSGDLEIDGISTKNYKASDWDTYRNNRIGFVFQSYNLIPHQNVLSNVELALTLSGVSKRERRRRAKEAIEKVGLGDHIRKKPNQLSGGQMQRVAIARALINDPEILLADEPTGALDSKTSLQVMELLTEIAKDRCVIMVTHNNELAEQYANRLVHLTDGKVTSDSHPFDPEKEKQREATPPRRSRMSFFTAISLSFSNLMTKKGRTFTTAFAGSIGIIGVATILAFSNGINAYIKGIEEDTLSVYPLSIEMQSLDISAFFGGGDDDNRRDENRRERPEGTVREIEVMETVFSSQSINDLAALKKHIDENLDDIEPYVNTIQYQYDITPQIYLADTSKGIDQINPDSIFSGFMGGGDMQAMSGIMPGMQMMNNFHALPNKPALYESQYEVLTGNWPQNYDEAVLVLQFGNRIMDFTLYSLGLRDREEMRAMLESFMTGTEAEMEFSKSEVFYEYDRLMTSFKVINPAEIYHYDETFEIWVDKSGDTAYMEELIGRSLDLKIVGIVQPTEDASTTVLQAGVNYSPDLIYHLIEEAVKMPIVIEQLENPDINVISGLTFEYEKENPPNTFDFSKIISVDEDILREAMPMESMMDAFDFENMDFSGLDMSSMDMSGFDMSNIDMSAMDFSNMNFSGINLDPDMMSQIPPPTFDIAAITAAMAGAVNIDPAAIDAIVAAVMADMMNEVMNDPAVLQAISDVDPVALQVAISAAMSDYLAGDKPGDIISSMMTGLVDTTAMQTQIEGVLQTYIMTAMQGYMTQMTTLIEQQISSAIGGMAGQIQGAMESAMSQVMGQISNQMRKAMTSASGQIEEAIAQVFEDMAAQLEEAMDGFDGDAMAEAFQINLSEEAVFELMNAMMNPVTTSYEKNLSMFGYADTDKPTQISFYPISFESKQEVLDFLDRYNKEMERTGQPEKVVTFIDMVGLMMSSVTSIIDMVSYALVAFVSVSLVVSSIMIGVITFVSVLERKKEIGILRAVGASKGNIRTVFNAETLIIGFVAGLIGVIVTYFIAIIANAIIWENLQIRQLVLMPPAVPPILVGVSMFLTFVAGLVPAAAAASKPPVEALRSE